MYRIQYVCMHISETIQQLLTLSLWLSFLHSGRTIAWAQTCLFSLFFTLSFSSFRWMTLMYYTTDASWIWGVESEILGMGAQHRNGTWGCRRMETCSGQLIFIHFFFLLLFFNLPGQRFCWRGWLRSDSLLPEYESCCWVTVISGLLFRQIIPVNLLSK